MSRRSSNPATEASYHQVCFDRLQRYQVIKQADTLLLITRLPEQFTEEEKLAAWEDFEPLCIHDSTLSFASHALFAAQNGLAEAAEAYWRKALYLDLEEVMGNTARKGSIWPVSVRLGIQLSLALPDCISRTAFQSCPLISPMALYPCSFTFIIVGSDMKFRLLKGLPKFLSPQINHNC